MVLASTSTSSHGRVISSSREGRWSVLDRRWEGYPRFEPVPSTTDLLGRDADAVAGIAVDEPFHHCLFQSRSQKRMDISHCSVEQWPTVLLTAFCHSSVFLDQIIELLDLDGCQVLQFDMTQLRIDVVADVVFLCSCSDAGLGIGFILEPHPFVHSIVGREVDGRTSVLSNSCPQIVFILCLRFAEHTLKNPLANLRANAYGITPLRSSIGAFA